MQANTRYLARYLRRFQFIYTVNLEEGPAWLRTHPSTDDRVAKLLAYEGTTAQQPAEMAEHRPTIQRRKPGVTHIPIRYVA
jgi:predicted Zn-dependent protease